MTIAAALLLIGACGSASRTITVEPSIERILVNVLVGGVKDVLARRTHETDWSADRIYASLEAADIRLRIDGQQRTGVVAWLAAAHRVAGYAISDSRFPRTADAGVGQAKVRDQEIGGRVGSVEYFYRLRIRGFDIWRTTRIEDGRVSLVTDVYGSIADGKLYHVRLTINAVEGANGTRIVGVATGDSEIGRNCRLISRIASRVIGDELDSQLLGRVQAGGIDLYRAGSLAEVLR